MKKLIKKISTLFLLILLNSLVIILIIDINSEIAVKDILLENFNSENNSYTIAIYKKNGVIDNLFSKDFSCYAESKEIFSNNFSNGKCVLTLPINENFEIYIKNGNKESKKVNPSNYISNILEFNFNDEIVYLTVGEKYKLDYSLKLVSPDDSFNFKSNNEEIATIKDGYIYANKSGKTTISNTITKKGLEVIVTDLISLPAYQKNYKIHLPCNKYSLDEANLLDKILEFKINKAGYKTRAGAVAAARFLTLEFPYRIPYFYENGRVHESGVNYADGEGRYYKKGLYLHDSKKSDIKASFSGPAIWGCPLTNWELNETYGYYPGVKRANGLDCSGFVSWVLYNAGFDPGDIGAGETEYPYQLTDLGNYTPLTTSLIYSDNLKVGDLLNYWGHIAIIVGIDDNYIYVAESLQNFGGVVTRQYKKSTINQTFTHVVLMDDYYKNDGNLKKMW